MQLLRRTMLVVAIGLSGVCCERKPQAVDSGTEDAKLRPEVVVARGEASPAFDEAGVSPAPSPPSP